MSDIHVRNVLISDTQAILSIYGPYVEKTAISFEIEVPSVDEMANRITKYTQTHPYLVAVLNDKVVGFAYAAPFSPREAYQYSSEVSIYIAEDIKYQGLGGLLYDALEKKLVASGVVQVISCITASNIASLNFFERRGFEKAGLIPKIGYKFEEWHDVAWLIKTINPTN